jgi:hypothetical protein
MAEAGRVGKALVQGEEQPETISELFLPEAVSSLDASGVAGYRKTSPYRHVAQGESTTLTR